LRLIRDSNRASAVQLPDDFRAAIGSGQHQRGQSCRAPDVDVGAFFQEQSDNLSVSRFDSTH